MSVCILQSYRVAVVVILSSLVVLAVTGDSGPTGDAFHDFVPDGSDVTETRDIIQTATDESADNDPKARWTKDAIIYTLDPVDDLQPGTYVASVQISDRGRPTDNNYRTPSVAKHPFQVGTATQELPPAADCATCH